MVDGFGQGKEALALCCEKNNNFKTNLFGLGYPVLL
jgi:hypothetical protein